MNFVVIVGRLTKDIELKKTMSGSAFANFNVAVNRSYKNEKGEKETDFINCVVWNKQAENLSLYCKKGSQIGVEGSIQTRNYEDKEGRKVYVTEVFVKSVTFLESKNSEKTNNVNQGDIDNFDIGDEELPF